MDEELPSATHEGVLSIMGVDLKVYRLDDGRTIFEADGLKRLFEAMASGAPMSEQDAMELARVARS